MSTITQILNAAQGGNPFDCFLICDIDETGSPSYFGFCTPNGVWMIKALTASSVRFSMGLTDYSSNWTNRAGLTYSLPTL